MQKTLNIIKSTKSWIRQGGVNTPNLNHFVAYAATQGLEKLAPSFGFQILITFFREEGDKTFWIFSEDHTKETALKILENPQVAYRLYSIWQKEVKKYYDFLALLKKYGIRDLQEDYQTFKKTYISEYAAAMITDYITVILSDQVFQELIQKYGKENREEIQKILLPQKRTFMNEEELSSLKISLTLKENLGGVNFQSISLSEIKKRYPAIYKSIKKHQENFFWIQVNYKYTEPVTEEKFLATIKETVVNLTPEQIKTKIKRLENYEELLKKDKQKIWRKLKISKEDQEKAELISLNGYWHDSRKKANLIGNYTANEFLKRFAKEYGYKVEELQFTLPQELDQHFAGRKLGRKILQGRMEFSTHIIGAKLPEEILFGEKAKEIVQMTKSKKVEVFKDLRGTPASYGIAQGKVKIIHNPKGQDIKEGEILVASMTRPDFVPLMKKAAAIVTDEGGITSHAAIISRELGKPCVVGTRIATEVLKDGDRIEVNANHGLIKILT